jgi:hypothetical protein
MLDLKRILKTFLLTSPQKFSRFVSKVRYSQDILSGVPNENIWKRSQTPLWDR